MTINEQEIKYYRTKVISKYINPIMEKYDDEEREYNAAVERVNRMLKGVKK